MNSIAFNPNLPLSLLYEKSRHTCAY